MSGAPDAEGPSDQVGSMSEGPGDRAAGSLAGDGGAGSSSTPPPGAPPAQEEALEPDLDALLKERDDYLDLAKRTKADFENYRRRIAAEVQTATARGKGELARDVVTALDDLERAIEAAGLDPEGDSEDGLSHGVLLMFRSLRGALAGNGIEAIDPKGEKFDPMVHEALSTQAAQGVQPGTVVEVMQKGYRLGDQLIRPARVVVSE
jgi:molecular chaperone GrpE